MCDPRTYCSRYNWSPYGSGDAITALGSDAEWLYDDEGSLDVARVFLGRYNAGHRIRGHNETGNSGYAT